MATVMLRAIDRSMDGWIIAPEVMYPSIVRSLRFLGIDYGRRRIGLAISDPTGMLARPLKTIATRGSVGEVSAVLASEIESLMDEEDSLAGIVLGLPRRLGGEPNDQTATVNALAASLRAGVSLPVILQDERLSSREAESLLARRITDWRERKALLDAASAAVILQDYLDERARIGAHADDVREDDRL
jgi:putative holliday junction resolvase